MDVIGRAKRYVPPRVRRTLRRLWPAPPTNRTKVLVGLDIARLAGVEIGALDRPLVRKTDGNVTYVEFGDRDYLRTSYKNDPNVDIEQIVNVDAIWGNNTLAEAIGGARKFDYVLASHVVEHVPDLISWLEEIRTILKPGGTLRLIVPDRRFTFDYLRTETNLADVIDAHLRKARAPLPRMILDFHLLARSVDLRQAWRGRLEPSQLVPMSSPESATTLARDALENGVYQDTHCTVFTPRSFITLFAEASEIGLINFRCDLFAETVRNQIDFLVGLSPSDDRAEIAECWNKARAGGRRVRFNSDFPHLPSRI